MDSINEISSSLDKIKSRSELLSAFLLKPNIRFENQAKDEQIILVLRAHPITQIYWIINGIILLIILFLLNFILPLFLTWLQILFFNIFCLVIILAYFWLNFLGWFFNLGIITTKRVLDIDLHSIIYKEVSMANLERIEDITSKSSGFFASIFDYGNLFIQTAGTEVNIEYINIPHPSMVEKIINQLSSNV